jgi:hypothetical protein
MERSGGFDATGWVCFEELVRLRCFSVYKFFCTIEPRPSSVAQRKRVGLITQRSEDRNLVELIRKYSFVPHMLFSDGPQNETVVFWANTCVWDGGMDATVDRVLVCSTTADTRALGTCAATRQSKFRWKGTGSYICTTTGRTGEATTSQFVFAMYRPSTTGSGYRNMVAILLVKRQEANVFPPRLFFFLLCSKDDRI